jgi:hypothetical protein
MSAGTLPAADKRLLDELETECECYLLCRVSPKNGLSFNPIQQLGIIFSGSTQAK